MSNTTPSNTHTIHTQYTHIHALRLTHTHVLFFYVCMYVCIYLCDYSACATSFRRRPHPLTVANLSWLPFTRLTVCRLKLQTVGQLRVGIKSSFGIESELWFANLLSSLVSRELVCCRFATTAGALRLRSALKTTRERENELEGERKIEWEIRRKERD